MEPRQLRHQDIRDGIAKLCEAFPGPYWRNLDREDRYPTEFVSALTEAGYLAALVPEEYGGSGLPLSAAVAILEELQRAGCNSAACHAQMYTMGCFPEARQREQKKRFLPKIASGALRFRHSASPSPRAAPTRARSSPSQNAATATMCSTGKKSGRLGPAIPT